MDPNEKENAKVSLLDRFRERWFPPAAAIGAFGAFVAAVSRTRPEPRNNALPANSSGPADPSQKAAPVLAAHLDRQYRLIAVLGDSASVHPFRNSLFGIAAGAGGKIFALGDNEVRIFDLTGHMIQAWKAPENASCIAVGPDGRVVLGAGNRVEIYDGSGAHLGGFAVGEKDRPAIITAIKVFQKDILVADVAVLLIRHFDAGGKQLGLIGTKSKVGKFILPNRSLDFDVDAKGVIRATDTGRHQVTAWTMDGSPAGSFGKFGMTDPADFVGCCNPVNLAIAPDGKVVTGEKMVARVKVYEPEGKLLAVIGPENFDPNCIHIHLAVDSLGRILAADPVRRLIKIFARDIKEA